MYSQTPTLVINEVSNGISGGKEYFEFLVVGPKAQPCQAPVTLDLREWIFDDNNGFLGAGNGKGIATGAFRFKNIPFWSAIPVGTLILIYNDADFESSLITNDLSTTDGNCTLVLPCTSNLLEAQTTSPTTSSSNYPAGGWGVPADWTPIGLRNEGDGVVILRPGNSTPVHSLGYGDITISNASIGFSGTGAKMVYAMKNSSSDDFNTVGNWSSETASNITQTPGKPNNAANQTYILSLSNGCQVTPTTVPSLQANVITPTSCGEANGKAEAVVTGGTQPISYAWSNGSQTANVDNMAGGNYSVIITDASGCKDTAQIVMPSSSGIVATVAVKGDSCSQGNGSAIVSVTQGTAPYQYTWSNGDNSSQSQHLAAGTYQVTVSDAMNCSLIKTVDITAISCGTNPNPTAPTDTVYAIEMPNVFSPNNDGNNDVYLPVKQTGIQVKSFIVLNRWGNVVFQEDTAIQWDGKVGGQEALPGVYFYKVQYVIYTGEEKELQGFFHLVK